MNRDETKAQAEERRLIKVDRSDEPLTLDMLEKDASSVIRHPLPKFPDADLLDGATYAAFVVRQWHPCEGASEAAQDKLWELGDRGGPELPDFDLMSQAQKADWHDAQAEKFPQIAAWQTAAIRASERGTDHVPEGDVSALTPVKPMFPEGRAPDIAQVTANGGPERPTLTARERLAAELKELAAEPPAALQPERGAGRPFGRD